MTASDDGKPRRDALPSHALGSFQEFLQMRDHAIDTVIAPFLDDARILRVVTLVRAGADATLRVVQRHKVRLADRLRNWIAELLFEYQLRSADPEEGLERAGTWLFHALKTRPPRRSPTEDDDARIVRWDQELRIWLAPVFAKFPRSAAARNAEARPIVERILGKSRVSLPLHDRLESYVADLLRAQRYSDTRRSRAAGRYRLRQADALANYSERKYRIALRANDAALAGVGLTRSGLEKDLSAFRRHLTALGSPRQRPRNIAR